ncbi:bacterio-opsin activator domain-containing protein [Salinigranum salinum]|uniref:bacterio-opsin activator domain-containing protein n=1 Tax=Salinigranum salinum TaxID=1364937 RepID=UPI001864F527|nr:bacterio-opsin activator domain-containing protein [Salinigranum salinum]
MGTETSPIDLTDVLAVFERQERLGTPLTAPEVADRLGCARRTAHKKLTRLSERGDLSTKKVGARGRVWWRTTRRGATASTTDGRDGRSGQSEEQTGRADHERALRELHDASRRLMRAERHEAVCDVAVETARRILGLSLCGLWVYEPGSETLEPVAWTKHGVEEYGEPPAFPVEESLVGRTFREGSYRVYDDVTAEEELYDPETRVRSELVLPLGTHGVLNATSPEVGAFDAVDVSLGRILAATVETALERADRLEERRERRQELERRRDELETLNQLNTLVEETIGALVGAATRAEIEDTVCERLADSAFYVDAWIVERGPHPEQVVLRTRAPGETDDAFPTSGTTIPGPSPALTTLEEGTLQVIPRIDGDERVPERLRSAARSRGARACLVVPLAYAETVFGALVVHAPDPDGFSDREQTAFETLGRVVGFVINATNNRQLLLGNTAVELEVALGGTDAWFTSVADRLGGTVTVEGLVQADGDAGIQYVRVDGVSGDVPSTLAATRAVADVRVLATEGDQWFLECTLDADGAGLRTIAAYGATVRTARASGGVGRVTARFPATTSPREALSVVTEAFPSAELIAKRVVDVSDRSGTTLRQRLTERWTDKQARALRAAYLAGYFDTPRRTTGRELAASLDIAPSTLHQHLQAAHRKLLATVFDELSAADS